MPHRVNRVVFFSTPSLSTHMPRLIKRYGSRKLYDTRESRYASLDEIASWVRQGQQIQVVDNQTDEDVTAAVLTQLISEEGRRGEGFLSPRFLHDLVRFGESALRASGDAVESGLEQARAGATEFVQKGIERLRPAGNPANSAGSPRNLTSVRAEMVRLREQLATLEESIEQISGQIDHETELILEETADPS